MDVVSKAGALKLQRGPVIHEISQVIRFIANYRVIEFDVIAIRWKAFNFTGTWPRRKGRFYSRGYTFTRKPPRIYILYIALIVYTWSILARLNIESRRFKRNRFQNYNIEFSNFAENIIATRPGLRAHKAPENFTGRSATFDTSKPGLSIPRAIPL